MTPDGIAGSVKVPPFWLKLTFVAGNDHSRQDAEMDACVCGDETQDVGRWLCVMQSRDNER